MGEGGRRRRGVGETDGMQSHSLLMKLQTLRAQYFGERGGDSVFKVASALIAYVSL